jgi:Spy/CpxP family protein refolding chaperone
MKKIWMVGLVVLISFALALPGSILAQTAREKVKEKVAAIKNLTPEQKAAIKKKVEDGVNELKNLTPEQKAEIKKKVTEAVDRLKNMTPEEKAQVKEAIGMFKELTPDQQKNLLKAIFKK